MTSKYKCPVCKELLEYEKGHQMDPKDGITIFCKNKACAMSDWGHGKDENKAFTIFNMKCGKE